MCADSVDITPLVTSFKDQKYERYHLTATLESKGANITSYADDGLVHIQSR